MPSTYSTSLRLELMADGEKSGTWGTITNTNLGTLIEQGVAGVASVAHDDSASYTLTTNNGSSDEARNAVVLMTGTLTADREVIVPDVDKVYIFKNGTSGGFALTFKTSGGSGVTIPSGRAAICYVDSGTGTVNAIDDGYFTDSIYIEGSSAGDFITAESTNAGATSGPDIKLYRNSASPADGDALSKITFTANTDDGAGGVSVSDVEYASITTSATETNETTGEAGKMVIALKRGGTTQNYIEIQGGTSSDSDNDSIVFKTGGSAALTIDNSQNVIIANDLTVDTNTLYVDATNNRVDINGGGSSATFDVVGSSANDWAGRFENTSATGFGILGVTASTDSGDAIFELRSGTTVDAFKVLADNDWVVYNSSGNASMHWDASAGSLGFGNQSAPRSRIDIYTGQSSGALTPVITMDWSSSTIRNNFIGIDDADEIVIAADESDNGTDSRIRFRVDAADQVAIFANNKVDIGNTGGGSAPSSTLSIAGQVGTQNGTAAAPTHTFYSDTDTGMYRNSANGLAFSTGGTLRGRFDSGGRFLLPGDQTSASVTGAQRTFQIAGTDGIIAGQSITRYSNDSGGSLLMFAKSRGTDPATNAQAVLNDGDYIAEIRFTGSNGTDLNSSNAKIVVEADGSQTGSSLPGMFKFMTTAGGNTSPTERLRLNSAGRLIHQEADVTVAQEAKIQFAGSNSASVWSAIDTGDNSYSSLPNEVAIMNTIDATSQSMAGIFMQAGETTSGSGVNAARIAAIREGHISTGLGMATRKSDGTMASRIYIRNDGNVGLSTDDPTRSLEIYRATPKLSLYDSSDGSSGWDYEQLFGAIQWRTADANVGGAGQINAYINVEHLRSGTGHTNPDAGIVFGISDGVTPTATDFMILDNYGNSGQRFLRLVADSDGIQFNGDTANVNALDDYEEGDWTPSLEGTTSNPTTTGGTFSGRYRKIGDMVVAWFDIQNTTISGGNGYIQIPLSDLPYAPNQPFGREIAGGSLETYQITWPHDGTIGTRLEPSEGIQFQVSRSGGSWSIVSCSNAAGSGRYIGGHVIYRTTAN